TYNQLGKVLTQKVHMKAGDIVGNNFNDTTDMLLITTYKYDNNGNLTTVTTPNGVTTTNAYDVLDRVTSQSQPGVDENANVVTITTSATYNWEDKPLTTTDANGNVTTYKYSPIGNLQTVADAKNGITAYYYDIVGRKIAEVSPKNYDNTKTLEEMNRTEYVYDLMNRVKTKVEKYVDPITSQFVSVITKAYTYDNNGNVILEQDALGAEGNYGTRYTYNLVNKQIYVLDPVSEDKGLPYTVKYDYDELGRKTAETNAKGIAASYTYDDAGNITVTKVNGQTIKTATYDLIGNVLTTTDGNSNTTTYEYNALGKVRKVIYESDATIPVNTVIYQYNNMTNLVYAQDSIGKVNSYTFDNQGRVLTQSEKKSDGSQEITVSVKYDKNGNKRYTTDANGVTTENTYDGLNKIISSKVTVSGVLCTTGYTYDANGNQTTITDWRGNTVTNVYDPINRVIEKDDQDGKVIEKLEYNKNNSQTKSTDALNNVTQFTYDKNNRLIATTDAEGHTTSKSYDSVGNVATKTDGRGIVTAYNYDQYNRLASVVNAKSEKTVYTYDQNGNMLTQKDAKGNTTTFEYNVANKLIKLTDPADKIEIYTYTADGKLATKTDRNGTTFTYTYDIHGRLVGCGTSDSVCPPVTYTYDNVGNQLTMIDSTGTTTRTYDELGRVLTKTVPVIGTSTFVYDITAGVPAGYTKDTTTDPKGHTVARVCDKVGRMVNIIADGKTTTYTYYDNGSKESVVYSDGSREDYTYYTDNLNKTLTNKKSDGTIIDTYNYTYDEAHNQTSKTDAKGVTTYTYDSVNRLESVTEPSVTEPSGTVTKYSYDKAGNRSTQVVTSNGSTAVTVYTYNEQNRLLSVTTVNAGVLDKTVYTYDNNGNTLSSAKSTIKAATDADAELLITAAGSSAGTEVTLNQYDVWNQLVKTIVGDKIVSHTYNGEGYRVAKAVNGDVTNYLYEGDKVILEVDGSGVEKARNVYGTNLVSRTVEGETLSYMYNGHADVTALLDNSGNIVATYYYDAFGNIIEQTGNPDNNITYAGYQYDKETGLYYLNARMYDPVTARFLQEDTYRGSASDPLSLNLYTYCHNEPMMYTDPSGHLEKSDEALKNSKDKNKNVDYTRLVTLTNAYNMAKSAGLTKVAEDARRAAVTIRKAYDKNYADSYKYKTKATTGNNSTSYGNGSKGSTVTTIQNALVNNGYSVGAYGSDSSFGNATAAAVVRYQIDTHRNNISGDELYYNGVVDAKTMASLGITIQTQQKKSTSNIASTVTTTQSPVNAGTVTLSYFAGIGDATIDTVSGLGNMVMHPIQTAQNVGTAVVHPIKTSEAIVNQISTAYENDVVNGDANNAARFWGNVTFQVGTVAVGTKGLDKATKTSKVVETVNTAEKVSKIETTADLLREAILIGEKIYVKPNILNEIGVAEAAGGKGFSGLTRTIIQSKPATWQGELTGGTQQIIQYSDSKGIKFIVHEVTEGNGLTVHRDFDAVHIQSGHMINKMK
ncbi:MAG TPA: hypothetical protein DEP72_02915, partial [Clostridiales bacterium]|nr:hypothetical protein [Clostridiales bacterium]